MQVQAFFDLIETPNILEQACHVASCGHVDGTSNRPSKAIGPEIIDVH